jgi:signal transduction histidine kinase
VRRFWFALKIGGLFAVVMGVALTATLMLFGRVAGHGLLRELGMLRAHEGLVLAERIEAMLPGRDLDDPAIASLIAGASEPLGAAIRLEPPEKAPVAVRQKPGRHRRPPEHVTVRGRRCTIVGPPDLETWVPVLVDGQTHARLVIGWPLHPPEEHHGFFVGLLEIGALALAGAAGLALYLTAPLRRMSRSMNRIAAGDLEHRVAVRGRDEVAAMGASFNGMADRISNMITGQKELLAGVSHELRSPLARMKMALELLRSEGAPTGRVGDLEVEVDTLDRMVDELLVASRLDLGSSQLSLAEVELAEAARRAWMRVESEAADKDMELVLEPADDTHLVWADQGLVVRALGNLFENAVRYAGRGAVRLTTARVGSRVELTVSDQGPGVDEDALKRLFEPFFRADPSRSRRTGATGLGLMIVRRIAEAHGGAARAARGLDGGLEVSFDLESGSGGDG